MKTECLEAFETKCSWLESTTQISSFDEIYNKMLELCETDCCYSVKTLRNKLKEKYSKPVYFVEEQTEESVVIAAAKIIAGKIREMEFSKDEYSTRKEGISIDKENLKKWTLDTRAFNTIYFPVSKK